MIINHNMTSLSAVNASRITHDMLQKSIQPLATGLRINSAADDASGIAISEKMRSQTAGYSMAVRNAQDGISLLQVAEGALGDTNTILQRMRELAVQSANDTLTSQDRQHIDEEVQALKGKLDMVADSTQFNTKKLLDGTSGLMWSGSDNTLKASVRGSSSLDVRPSGSYRLEIHADPGKAQVQKSNIFEAGKLYKIEQVSESEDDGEAEAFTVYSEEANTLRDISQFHKSDGTFIVSEPQKLTLVQGNGQTASLTLYEHDTLYDLADKINSAVSDTLGQAAYVDDAGKFSNVTDIQLSPDDGGDTYTVNASLVIRSALPGKSGELFLSGNDDLLGALGMNTVQESSESTYSVSIYDADSGEALASDVKVTGNVLYGAIGDNIDVEFDPMAGTRASWDSREESYTLTGDDAYSAFVNLKNSGIIFQIGTNQAENFAVQFGDVSSEGLGVGGVNVMTRELASRSISLIDRAIEDVVKQRTQIVSYSDSLQHSATNLAQSGSNLTEARSRITDADEAKSTLRFIEFQILSKGQDMIIAVANQQPEAVYSLLNKD
ncbi:MAG: hypothetical protein IJS28_02670 [Synergistaceae bacterium]|nr:hypothetical protein [Synergistaceae bacterium]